LPKELQKLVKEAKITKEEVDSNLFILLSILSFQTKIKFRLIEERKQELVAMSKIRSKPPKTQPRPVLTIEKIVTPGDPKDLYKFVEEQGKGGFGEVYSAVKKDDDRFRVSSTQ
jgi:hypothetical protein